MIQRLDSNSLNEQNSGDFEFQHRESSVCNRISLSPESNQEGDVLSYASISCLGLTLSKTQSLIDSIQTKLSEPRSRKARPPGPGRGKAKADDSDKLKASNFPALVLQIGSWKRLARHEGDLIAKCYYAKKKLVWEVLEGALKVKIEIQWSHVIGIRAIMRDDEPGILELELNQPPQFFRETNPQPRKHTIWEPGQDFTRGQATTYRRHCMKFPPGTLDKHYEKLLQCDSRILDLSKRTFPQLGSPYFPPNIYGFELVPRPSEIPYCTSPIPPASVPSHPVQSFNVASGQSFGIVNSESPLSVTDIPWTDENMNMNMNMNDCTFQNQETVKWGQEGNNVEVIARGDQTQRVLPPYIAAETNAAFSYSALNTGEIADLENQLLSDSQYESSQHEEQLQTFLETYEQANLGTSSNVRQLGCQQQNFSVNPSVVFGTTEHYEGEGGLMCAQPISWLPPPQVSNENVMMNLPSGNLPYPYDF